ncbi:MAG: FAD:protein FMN transferase [Gemmatimonadota bacterium]
MADAHGGRGLPGRRAFLSVGLGAFVVATLPWARRAPKLVRRRLPLMGTIAEVGVVHRDERFAWTAAGAALDALSECEGRLTRFRPESEVGRINEMAHVRPVTVSATTADVLEAALAVAERSGGRFDPCLGRMVVAWDVAHRRTPLAPEISRGFASRELHRLLDLERTPQGARVRALDADVALDLGGIGKGHGVDRAVAVLREWGIRDGLVNVGGDLFALGRSPEGDPWTVGVRSPEDARVLLRELEVSDAAVATSGDYQQGFDYEGRRYAHILDPVTGAPVQTPVRTLTVEAETCMEADAWATAAFGLTAGDADALLAKAPSAVQLIHVA